MTRSSTATPPSEAIHDYFLDNKLYSNLPRKYKVSVTGCAEDCARGLINDIALSGGDPPRTARAASTCASAAASPPQPRFARWMDIFVTPEEAPEVVAAVTGHLPRLRGEPEGARQGAPEVPRRPRRPRGAARGARSARRPPAAPRRPEGARACRGEDHVGVLPQADGAHRTVGLVVPVGRLKASPAVRARRARPQVRRQRRTTRCASRTSRTSLLPWIPEENVDALLAEPLIADLTPTPTLFQRGLQTCTGKEFCGLAKVYTKSRAVEIAKFLDEHVRPNGHGEDFRLHFAGCSSSCAQHQIADVGIEGVLKKVDGEFVEAMDIRIGGRLGENPKFGDVVVKKVPHWDLNETLLRIFTLYEQQPRRRRDVPRLRGPHRARVVDARADARSKSRCA